LKNACYTSRSKATKKAKNGQKAYTGQKRYSRKEGVNLGMTQQSKRNELRYVRTRIAVAICNDNPALYFKVRNQLVGMCKTAEEATAYGVLTALIEAEPTIQSILDFYQTEHKI
jgi:isocitrate dehydrogenase